MKRKRILAVLTLAALLFTGCAGGTDSAVQSTEKATQETPGYAAMEAPTDYVSSSSDYTKAGFIYVNAGCRGRDAGAPAGVTDLKAAVRRVP